MRAGKHPVIDAHRLSSRYSIRSTITGCARQLDRSGSPPPGR
ncbi:Uncharacterised protein [Amycolatopsis camponoti]|uniref:Uncharacterized protein n=1 Tax=Amycolatopsis camponoti TaxID=2606593 RepID=A0A6I8M028_9PSEU|nr:Uncharacterised protein [Amycolatopsis camponoti]